MRIQKLLKFGKSEHLKDLLAGKVYINHASFFKKKIDHGMFDVHEGQESIKHLQSPSLKLKGHENKEWKTLNLKSGIFESINDLSNVHIYSLFQISEQETLSNEYFELSNEIKTMGDFFIVINNPKLFIERLDNVLKDLKYEFFRDSVKYYDPSTNQENLTVFHKRNSFEYQREFRYIIKANTQTALKLDIGPISEISEFCHSSKIKGFKFQW